MTNPTNKKTRDQFISEINPDLGITILGEYINTDTPIEYRCQHGTFKARPWQILKQKHCCRKGYYQSGKMWASNTISLEEARQRVIDKRPQVDVSESFFESKPIAKGSPYSYKILKNVKCLIHNLYYDSYMTKATGLCPECLKQQNLEKILAAGPLAWSCQKISTFVSKAETKWLDELGISERQYWLSDVKYKVDGYDPKSNTVYLYHGMFWHGHPDKFAEGEIHPVLKLPAAEIYEKTLHYEEKIRKAGYNLITKWGT